MVKTWFRMVRGAAAVCVFLCAITVGASSIATVTSYKAMINTFLGGASAQAGSAEAYAFTSDYESTTEMLTERKRIAEQLSEEGSVLLKNENDALPLRKDGEEGTIKVTVLGSRAYTYDSNGGVRDADPSGSLSVYGGITGSRIYRDEVTVEEGTLDLPITLEMALDAQDIEINPYMVDFYSGKNFPSKPAGSEASGDAGVGSEQFAINEPAVSYSDVRNAEEYSDACIVMIGRASGEGRDYRPGQRGITGTDGAQSALHLSDDERGLIETAKQVSDNVIVLLNSAVAMELDEVQEDSGVDSILWIGLPGSYGMNGVARLISGAASPSGHLPDIYATDASASPAAQNFGTGAPDGTGSFTWSNPGTYTHAYDNHYVVLAEGIYTGYYYYETRYADCVNGVGNANSSAGAGRYSSGGWNYAEEVTYPFGYGLSYSTFTQKLLPETFVADYENKTISVDVEVQNTGSVAAKSAVQLYAQSPYTAYDKAHGVEKSAVQLVAIAKTDTLEPGSDPVTLTLTVDMKYLASYDETYQHDNVTGGYILENAEYGFSIGNGSHDALNNILAAQGADESKLYEIESTTEAQGYVGWTPSHDSITFDGDGVNGSFFAYSESGTLVQNQLQNADYNYYNEGEVTYLSRSDWQGTFPVSYTSLERTDGMTDALSNSVYKWQTGTSDIEFGVDHTLEYDENGEELENMSVAEMKLASFEDERWDYLLSQITIDEAWYFAPDGGARCRAFESVNAPEVWQIDGPNGSINRTLGQRAPSSGTMAIPQSDPNYGYFTSDMCCQPVTAATFNLELIREQGRIYGEDLLWNRSPIMWAPGLNLHRTPFNSRNHEYYSEDPMLTNLCGTAFVGGGLEKGAILAAKHFAFNSQETYREGLSQFFGEQAGRELELRAFQGIIEDIDYVNSNGNTVNALGLMSSFSRVGVTDGNAHTGMMKNILRGEWGFKGLISTDYVSGNYYFNPRDSVINNVTFMAYGSYNSANDWTDYNKNSVSRDPAMMQALYDNMHYYMYAIANSSALNGYDAETRVVADVKEWWQTALEAFTGIFAALGIGGTAAACVLYVVSERKKKGGETAAEVQK